MLEKFHLHIICGITILLAFILNITNILVVSKEVSLGIGTIGTAAAIIQIILFVSDNREIKEMKKTISAFTKIHELDSALVTSEDWQKETSKLATEVEKKIMKVKKK